MNGAIPSSEKVLYQEDLSDAEEIYLGNSVRRLVGVEVDFGPGCWVGGDYC